MAKKLDGADYRLRKMHPRRTDQPLGAITAKGGQRIIGPKSKNCSSVSQEHLKSMISNGYVELIPKETKAKKPAKKKRGS